MKNSEWLKHVKGESEFIDDMDLPEGSLFGAILTSDTACGTIADIDYTEALKVQGVYKIIDHNNIPGKNQIGTIIEDEELFAENHIKFAGEPIALVLADSRENAVLAVEKIRLKVEKETPVTDPREAYDKGMLLTPPRIFSIGDFDNALADCDYIVSGTAETGAQEHFYMEPQGSIAFPIENRGIRIYSSTQSPTAVQRVTARVLGMSMNDIEVDVRRLGGGFGGKEDQATPWAVMAALGALLTGRAVKIVLDRRQDITMTGKRHPFSSDFKIGLKKDGKIAAYEVTLFQSCGACADLSTAIMERAMFHATNSYYIPNVRITGISAYTNLPPFTAFRGFGAPQAVFVIESAINKVSLAAGMDPIAVKEKNLLKESDLFPYGMAVKNCNIRETWQRCGEIAALDDKKKEISEFNRKEKLKKRGLEMIPVTFGISFTNSILNQAGSLVHIYTDGSISVSTGAIEMGQGVNQKIRGIVSKIFSVDESRIKLESTNTTRVANTSPTAASSGADLNGKATENACLNLRSRLSNVAAELLDSDPSKIVFKDETVSDEKNSVRISWDELITATYAKRKNLSSQAYYATPGIFFDRKKEKGEPFAYHVFGTAVITSELDVVRGTYELKNVTIVHDSAKSLNELIDRGQIEGGFIQGTGWMTVEEIIINEKGILKTNTSSAYKVPDLKSLPDSIKIEFFNDKQNPYAVMGSKAVGEPPFLYGIGSFFSILNAVFQYTGNLEIKYSAPLTPEKVLKLLMKRDKT